MFKQYPRTISPALNYTCCHWSCLRIDIVSNIATSITCNKIPIAVPGWSEQQTNATVWLYNHHNAPHTWRWKLSSDQLFFVTFDSQQLQLHLETNLTSHAQRQVCPIPSINKISDSDSHTWLIKNDLCMRRGYWAASVYTTKNANLNTNYCFMRRHICQTSEHEEYHRKREVRRDQVSAHCFFGHGRWLLSIARLTPHPLLLHLCHYSWHSSSLPQPKSAETLTETISCHSELNKKSYTCYTVCKYDQNHKLYVTKSRAFWKKNGLLQSSNVQIWTDYCRLVSCSTDYPNATDCYDYLNSASTVC